MNALKSLTLLSLVSLTFVGCNEKVSSELQTAASSTTLPPIVPPETYYFRVQSASSVVLGYNMHKTGAGNGSVACEVSHTGVALSNDLYTAGYDDISCFYEVEELALWMNGIDFQMQASENTCDYVAYAPFSYFNRQPGNSSTTIYEIECDPGAVTPTNIMNSLSAGGYTEETVVNTSNRLAAAALGVTPSCSQMVDDGNAVQTLMTAGLTRQGFNVSSDEDLCRFNYQDGAEEKCDVGTITVNKLTIPDTGVAPVVESRTIRCGGRSYNCIAGAQVLGTTVSNTTSTSWSWITPTTRNQPLDMTYSYPGRTNAATSPGSIEYANYRRNLASLNIEYFDSDENNALYGFGYTYSTDYLDSFGGYTDFTTALLDRYSRGVLMDSSTPAFTTTQLDYASAENDGVNVTYTKRPLAAEPFMGLAGHRTQPFYTFYCLDNDQDIKARIRVMVREWDRVPLSSSYELISDMNLSAANRRQDAFGLEEIPGDMDGYNNFNDIWDWDDTILMTRDFDGAAAVPTAQYLGPYNASETVWSPSSGFFSSSNFPNHDYGTGED